MVVANCVMKYGPAGATIGRVAQKIFFLQFTSFQPQFNVPLCTNKNPPWAQSPSQNFGAFRIRY